MASSVVGKDSPVISEEQGILAEAHSIITELKVGAFHPRQVQWKPFYVLGQGTLRALAQALADIPSDQPRIEHDKIILRKAMMGKLGTREWRPLLESSIIYSRRLRGRRTVALVTRLILPLVAFSFGFFLLVTSVTIRGSWTLAGLTGAFPSTLIFSFALLVPLLYFFSSKMRVLRFLADMEVVKRSQASEDFAHVLRKIDEYRLTDVEDRKRFRARLLPWPSISERIQNLESEK